MSYRKGTATSASAGESNLTLEKLSKTIDLLRQVMKPQVVYQASRHVPPEIVNQETGEIATMLVLPDALSDGRSLVIFHDSHEQEFLERMKDAGIVARPVDWDKDAPVDRWLTPIPYIH